MEIEGFHATLLDNFRIHHAQHPNKCLLSGFIFSVKSYNTSKSQFRKYTPEKKLFGHIRNVVNEILNTEEQ